jgi:hypothetical protein
MTWGSITAIISYNINILAKHSSQFGILIAYKRENLFIPQ